MVCFARQGFHRATMQDIVREAQLSPGAIYRYFASKDEIIDAIAAERHARERQRIAQARRTGDARTALREVARAFFGALKDPEELRQRRIGVQVWAEALRNPRVLQIVRRGVDRPRATLAAVVRSAQRRGEVPVELDPDTIARAMIALFHGFVLQQAWDPRAKVAPFLAVIETVVEALTARGSAHAVTERVRSRPRRNTAGR
jgi:TetR/AcrR family transcriptional regulator, transcriptional repressor of aconitase